MHIFFLRFTVSFQLTYRLCGVCGG